MLTVGCRLAGTPGICTPRENAEVGDSKGLRGMWRASEREPGSKRVRGVGCLREAGLLDLWGDLCMI